MPTEDDGLESFDEEELAGEEEDDAGEGSEAPQEAAPAPKPNGKKRKPRNDKGGTHKPPGEGWNSREAELMWPEILQRIPRMQPPKTPYDINVQVVRFSPQAMTLPGAIEGANISGGKGVSPGDMLRRAIEDHYHLPSGRGPEEYEVRFVWKVTGRIIGRGRLSMPSSEEIEGFRRAAEHIKRRRPYGGVAVPSPYEEDFEEPPPPPPRRQAGMGAAPSAPVYPAPSPGMYPGFGASAQQPAANDEVGYLRQQVGYLSGQLQQLVGALTKGGVMPSAPAPVAPQGFGAVPVAPVPDFEERMVALLTKLGVVKAGVGATPPSSTSVASELHAGVSAFKTVVGLGKELRSLARELSEVYDDGDVGPREPPPETLVAEPVVTPPKPEDSLPFEVIPIPETNFLGHPAKYAVDKETGQFSREGFLMANPGLAEKALELGGRALEILGRLGNQGAGVAGAPQQQAAQVVSQIPAGAVDAGVSGNVAPQEPDGFGNNEGGL